MRSANVFFAVSCSFALATACSSSSQSNNAGDAGATDSGGGSGEDAGTSGDDSSTGPTLGPVDGGFPIGFPQMDATITCMSAADCTDGGAGQVCCFSLSTFSTSCVPGQCAMNDYQQCAGSDSECPAGNFCIPSPLGMGVHYCSNMPGDGGPGPGDAAASDGATE